MADQAIDSLNVKVSASDIDRKVKIAAVVALTAGVALTAYGILNTRWHIVNDYYRLLFGAALVFTVIGFVRPSRVIQIPLLLSIIVIFATENIWPFLTAISFFYSSYILGRTVLVKLGNENPLWVEAIIAGAGLYGFVVGCFAMLPVNYPGLYWAMLLLPFIGKHEIVRANYRAIIQLLKERPDGRSDLATNISIGLIAAISGVYFLVALMPEIGHDALAMHLFISSYLAANHHWSFDVTNYVWAVVPMLGDWIFSIGYMLGGENASRLINFGFIVLNAALIYEIVRALSSSYRGGLWAVLLFFSTPLAFTESSSLFIESVWSAFVLAGFLMIARVGQDSSRVSTNLPATGLFFGLATCSKAVTFSFVPAVVLYLVFQLYRCRPSVPKTSSLVKMTLLALLIGLYPYFIAWLKTGNPLFPFFNQIFKSQYWPAQNFTNSLFNAGLSWDTPYRVIFESGAYLEAYPGAAGFQWLVLLLPVSVLVILGKRHALSALLLAVVLMVAGVFWQQSYLRYIFPSIALFCAVVGVVLGTADRTIAKILLASVSGVILLNSLVLFSGAPWYGDFPVKAILSSDKRRDFLSERLPLRSAVDIVNELNRNSSPVLFLSSPFAAGLKADALYVNWYNHTLEEKMRLAATGADYSAILNARNVEYIVSDRSWSKWPTFPTLDAALKDVTSLVAETGSIEIRRVKSESRYLSEKLKNNAFDSLDSWSVSSPGQIDGGTGVVTVSVSRPVTQVIQVGGGQRLLNAVRFKCVPGQESGIGRAQVNWLNGGGKFITTSIVVAPCENNWKTLSQELFTPKEAVVGIVYGSSHTDVPVEIDEISLRQ